VRGEAPPGPGICGWERDGVAFGGEREAIRATARLQKPPSGGLS